MIRGMGLRGALSVNVITMIGIGPLITIPLVLAKLHGSLALWGWLVGALVALCDGLIWAELGSLYPGSGGTYAFLREAFGAERWGRLFAFLFAWQIVFAAPMVLASGYIGFAQYAGYLWAPLAGTWWLQGLVGAIVGLVTIALLYRPIGRIAATGLGLALVSVGALLAVIVAASPHFSLHQAVALDPHVPASAMLYAGLGGALVITLYDYYGYGAAATVGDEIREPVRVLPFATIGAILIVAVLYVLLQIAVLGAIPWSALVPATPTAAAPDIANYVGSAVVERGWGVLAARVVTVAILVTAFASTFGNLLAYSRIPYAAARDGIFLRPFARLSESGRFPHVSLLVIGLLAIPACWLSLGDVIAALTTGLVIVQSLGQCAAVFALRAKQIRAPYRVWLYPIPNAIAIAGWLYIFCSSGLKAIVFGLVTIAAGIAVYLWRANADVRWPFAKAAACIALAVGSALSAAPSPAAASAGIVQSNGSSTFEVDGKPFFVYGAAFFYERLPREQWATSLDELKRLGVNTLDLYVIWNWHETADGVFDFDGHSSPRRDLRTLLKLAHERGFKLLVRPGPVIRNEWRNGGYPAWLLQRPEYGMPQHDLLEGRYPPTATLQNAHSDDAAAEWMRNATHLRYSKRWLTRALREFVPYRNDVIGIALDDDQGAYLDNQTWPAPHLTQYLNLLSSYVHGAGWTANVPLYINTYQMKVTAASPVWAMGNWYQSDAYALGEHDRAQLEFSLGLLGTRPGQPVMLSEFQAGWLLGPDEVFPRAADPANTALALTTALGLDARGVVLFPAQDTLYPTGWEAPFANFFYAWDAALPLTTTGADRPARYAPTREMGRFLTTFGADLAAAHPHWDAQIGYMTSSFDEHTLTQADVNAVADGTIELQRSCRLNSLACTLVDLRYADAATLHRTRLLFLPVLPNHLLPEIIAKLRAFVAAGGIVVPIKTLNAETVEDLLQREFKQQTVDYAPGAVFSQAPKDARELGFLTVPNYTDKPLGVLKAQLHINAMLKVDLPDMYVPPHGVLLTPINLDLRRFTHGLRKPVTLVATDCPFFTKEAAPNAPGFVLDPPAQPGAALVLQSDMRCTAAFKTAAGDQVVPLEPDSATGIVIGRDGSLKLGSPKAMVTVLAGTSGPVRRLGNGALGTVPIRTRDAILPGPPDFGLSVPPGRSEARTTDAYSDGFSDAVLQNALVRVVIAPQAGARAFAFEDLAKLDFPPASIFTSVGGLRDDVAIEPPLSTTDRIAKFTHDMPAGMFNRPYRYTIISTGATASVRFSYDAPDVLPHGAHFERVVTLPADARYITVDERVDFPSAPGDSQQRAVSVTSLDVGPTPLAYLPEETTLAAGSTTPVAQGSALGYFSATTGELATIAWRAGDVEGAAVLGKPPSAIARLTLASGRTAHLLFGYSAVKDREGVARELARLEALAQGAPPTPANSRH